MGLYNQSLNENVDNVQVNDKIGSGSGIALIKQTLYTNTGKTAQSIELSDSYKNYDLIVFKMIRIADGVDNYQDEKYFGKDYLESSQVSNSHFQFFAYNQWITYRVENDNKFSLVNNANDVYVSEVIGIKL